MAIAWMYREDYGRAGYWVLPRDEGAKLRLVNWQTLLPLMLLPAVTLSPGLNTKWDAAYSLGALLLCATFLYYGVRFVIRKSNASARQLLLASIIYLPSLFLLMILFGELQR